MLDVTYYIEKQHGVERRYPVSEWAKRFCWIAGTKTLGDDLFLQLKIWTWDECSCTSSHVHVQLKEVLRKESD